MGEGGRFTVCLKNIETPKIIRKDILSQILFLICSFWSNLQLFITFRYWHWIVIDHTEIYKLSINRLLSPQNAWGTESMLQNWCGQVIIFFVDIPDFLPKYFWGMWYTKTQKVSNVSNALPSFILFSFASYLACHIFFHNIVVLNNNIWTITYMFWVNNITMFLSVSIWFVFCNPLYR